MSNNDGVVQDIKSARPYANCAREYKRKGWAGPLPLPANKKFPPPTGWTGRAAPFPTGEQIDEWIADPKNNKANIGLHLGPTRVNGEDYEVIGIDVDDYPDGNAEDGTPIFKKGGQQLRNAERRLGKLPLTWISSSRLDGVSGIRLFLVPAGYSWVGKVEGPEDSIEIIQKVHRYAAVYPSYHPKGGQYRWYEPGQAPDGTISDEIPMIPVSKELDDGTFQVSWKRGEPTLIPDTSQLAVLPPRWVKELTRDHMKETDRPIDMDSSLEELDKWAAKTLTKGRQCKQMKKYVADWKEKIRTDATSHDKVMAAHWNMINGGVEGHPGWKLAVSQIEKFWTTDVFRRQKRGSLGDAKREMFRSRTNAMRKVKAKVDEALADGMRLNVPQCSCFEDVGIADDNGPQPQGKALDPGDYRMNDDGNGDHLCDLYGDTLAFVPFYSSWMYWNGDRWSRDEDGLARRCFRRVRDRQEAYATQLMNVAIDLATSGDEDKAKSAKNKALEWQKFSRRSGSNPGAVGALEAAQANEGVSIPADRLDTNPRLLGVNNGLLELTDKGYRFRKASHDDFVTMNTNVDFLPIYDQLQAGGDSAKGVKLWMEYLDLFIPDQSLRRFIQKAMGYCLLGNNTERLAIFLYGGTSTGKSTMLQAVMGALGEYAETVDLGIFKEKASGLNPALAQALPRRIITASEASSQNHLHADIFKRITGGDRISAELKGVNVIVTRVPAFTPIIATNTPPTIVAADAALQRRLLVIPFEQQIADDEDRKSASMEMSDASASCVLAWLAEGWAMYCKEGLPKKDWPREVKGSTAMFGNQLNDLGEFLTDCTEKIDLPEKKSAGGYGPDPEGFVSKRELFDAYKHWATIEQGIPEREVLSQNKFSRQIATMGLEELNTRVDGARVRGWIGLNLREQASNVQGIFKRE